MVGKMTRRNETHVAQLTGVRPETKQSFIKKDVQDSDLDRVSSVFNELLHPDPGCTKKHFILKKKNVESSVPGSEIINNGSRSSKWISGISDPDTRY